MVPFYDWCDSADMPLGNHHVRVMTGRPEILRLAFR